MTVKQVQLTRKRSSTKQRRSPYNPNPEIQAHVRKRAGNIKVKKAKVGLNEILELAKVGYQKVRPTRMQVIGFIRRGFLTRSLSTVSKQLEIKEHEMMALVQISSRTFDRRKKEGRLHPEESERVYRINRLLNRAIEVFEEESEAVNWLKTPNIALSDMTPLNFSDTEEGAKEVKDLLGRIEHGVFS